MDNDERLARQRASYKKWYENNLEKARERQREATRRYRARNREKHLERDRETQRRRRAANPEHYRALKFRSTYGITVEQRDAMFTLQGNKCASCGSDSPDSKRGWHTDHCHTTGKVRAILCNPCNLSLGLMKEDPARLRALADYAERHNQIDQKPGASSSNASGATSSSEPSS